MEELEALATKLLQDLVAAMTMSYSQGQTEGRVKKLKLIKRLRIRTTLVWGVQEKLHMGSVKLLGLLPLWPMSRVLYYL